MFRDGGKKHNMYATINSKIIIVLRNYVVKTKIDFFCTQLQFLLLQEPHYYYSFPKPLSP